MNTKTFGLVILAMLLVSTLLIYPMLARQNRGKEVPENPSTQTEVTASAEEKEDGLKFTWKTAVLGGIALSAGVLRVRHRSNMRSKAWDDASQEDSNPQ